MSTPSYLKLFSTKDAFYVDDRLRLAAARVPFVLGPTLPACLDEDGTVALSCGVDLAITPPCVLVKLLQQIQGSLTEGSAAAAAPPPPAAAGSHRALHIVSVSEARCQDVVGTTLAEATVWVAYRQEYLVRLEAATPAPAGETGEPSGSGAAAGPSSGSPPYPPVRLGSPEEAAHWADQHADQLSEMDAKRLRELSFAQSIPVMRALSYILAAVADWVLSPQALEAYPTIRHMGPPYPDQDAPLAVLLRPWAFAVRNSSIIKMYGNYVRPSLFYLRAGAARGSKGGRGGGRGGVGRWSLLEVLSAPPMRFDLAREVLDLDEEAPQEEMEHRRRSRALKDCRAGWIITLQRLAALAKVFHNKTEELDTSWHVSVHRLQAVLGPLLEGDPVYSAHPRTAIDLTEDEAAGSSRSRGGGGAGAAAGGGSGGPFLDQAAAVTAFLQDLGATPHQVAEVLALSDIDSNIGFCAECGKSGDLVACDGCVDSFCCACLGIRSSKNLPDPWFCQYCRALQKPTEPPPQPPGTTQREAPGRPHKRLRSLANLLAQSLTGASGGASGKDTGDLQPAAGAAAAATAGKDLRSRMRVQNGTFIKGMSSGQLSFLAAPTSLRGGGPGGGDDTSVEVRGLGGGRVAAGRPGRPRGRGSGGRGASEGRWSLAESPSASLPDSREAARALMMLGQQMLPPLVPAKDTALPQLAKRQTEAHEQQQLEEEEAEEPLQDPPQRLEAAAQGREGVKDGQPGVMQTLEDEGQTGGAPLPPPLLQRRPKRRADGEAAAGGADSGGQPPAASTAAAAAAAQSPPGSGSGSRKRPRLGDKQKPQEQPPPQAQSQEEVLLPALAGATPRTGPPAKRPAATATAATATARVPGAAGGPAVAATPSGVPAGADTGLSTDQPDEAGSVRAAVSEAVVTAAPGASPAGTQPAGTPVQEAPPSQQVPAPPAPDEGLPNAGTGRAEVLEAPGAAAAAAAGAVDAVKDSAMALSARAPRSREPSATRPRAVQDESQGHVAKQQEHLPPQAHTYPLPPTPGGQTQPPAQSQAEHHKHQQQLHGRVQGQPQGHDEGEVLSLEAATLLGFQVLERASGQGVATSVLSDWLATLNAALARYDTHPGTFPRMLSACLRGLRGWGVIASGTTGEASGAGGGSSQQQQLTQIVLGAATDMLRRTMSMPPAQDRKG